MKKVEELEHIANTELQRNEILVSKILDDELKEKLAEFKLEVNLRIQTELSQIQPLGSSKEVSLVSNNQPKGSSSHTPDAGIQTSSWANQLFANQPGGRTLSISNEYEIRRQSIGGEFNEIGEGSDTGFVFLSASLKPGF